MIRRLIGPCTPDERLQLAIAGEEVLTAIQEGLAIELDGVVVTGDVSLDRLPVEPVLPKDRALALVGDRLTLGHIENVRRVRAPVQLSGVEVQGIWATNFVRDGYLIIEENFLVRDTVIQQSMDFSRTAFLGTVDFSGSTILYEGFFIQTVFAQGANFRQMHFGTHSRFHKAVFGGPTLFQSATFQGLAEFLEVAFLQEADFSGVQFIMGTGFSGAQFRQKATFAHSGFDREAYFRFTEFEADVTFQGASFGAAADFTEAKFLADWDFAGTRFAVGPQFPEPLAKSIARQGNRWQDPRVQAGMFGVLTILFLLYLYRARKSQRKTP